MPRLALVPIAVAGVLTGCGTASQQSAVSTATTGATAGTTVPQPAGGHTNTAPATPPVGALQAEANAAAAGDIPDNQVFLVFKNTATGYTIKYPEGWALQGSAGHVVIRDKNNIVRVVVSPGRAATPSSVRHELQTSAIRVQSAPELISLNGKPAVKLTYSSLSAPNAVTGRRVHLSVDRYYLWNGHRRAVVDLGTPVGVDNVDAYRLMIQSFRWQ
jgi:hypothetical protein